MSFHTEVKNAYVFNQMASLNKAHLVYLLPQLGEVSLFAGVSRLGLPGNPFQTAFAAETQTPAYRTCDDDTINRAFLLEASRARTAPTRDMLHHTDGAS